MNRISTILLVEDNPDDLELALRAFHTASISSQIVIAHDGQEALDYLFTASANGGRAPETIPELILLDLKLPKVDGIGVLRCLRADERTKRLPVVMLTSSNNEKDITACYDLGANGFVRKPIDFSDLVKAISVIGLYWLQLNEPPPVSVGKG